MTDPTENTVNELMASYLRSQGIEITGELSSKAASGRRQPDFELRNGKLVYGEGEWNSSYSKGMSQAIDYGDIPGSSGYFILGYPESLRRKIKQERIQTTEPEELLSGVEYRGLLKLKDTPSSIFKGQLRDIPVWITDTLDKKPKKDPEEYVRIMRDFVHDLSNYLVEEPLEYQSLFENVVSSVAEKKGKRTAARKAAAYLLLNQIVFYSVISKEGHVPLIDESSIKVPGQLHEQYFKLVTDKIDYHAIFDFDVASIFPKKSNQFIVDIIRNIKEIAPEEFTRNLLGSIFHSLIPKEVRKPLAAYYTNPTAASLLANLSIETPKSCVADLACGSGTLLVAAYNRKSELSGGEVSESKHKRFIEKELTGIDVMPFAAHLAVVQLGLKNPGYMTDNVRIGVSDSTTLSPDSIIDPLHKTMPKGQRKIYEYEEKNLKKLHQKEGAISGRGAGTAFKMGYFDVVLMNPPFSRKQNITRDLRMELQTRFKDYPDYISDEQNYNLYFVYLADKFLNSGGRIAMVLPATMLKQESSVGFRKLMRDRYEVEFIILTEFRSAFSEDTSFRDMLFIASKRANDTREKKVVTAILKVLPSQVNYDEIKQQLVDFSSSKSAVIETSLMRAKRIGQKELLDSEDWNQFLPGETLADESLPPGMVKLGSVVDRVVQGFRYEMNSEFVSTKDTMISIPRDGRVRIDLQIDEILDSKYSVKNPIGDKNFIIPFSSTSPAIRTASWQKTIEIKRPMDFIIMERFSEDESLWSQKDIDKMLVKRREHIESRRANLTLAGYGNIDLSSPGTFFLAFYSKELIAPTWSFWSLPCSIRDHSIVLSLWLNSSFALAELLQRRTEVRGTNIKWRKGEIEKLAVPDISNMSKQQVDDAKSLFVKVNKMDSPSLIEQLENSFEGRMLIDRFFADILDMKKSDKEIVELHREMSARLRKMQSMMKRD